MFTNGFKLSCGGLLLAAMAAANAASGLQWTERNAKAGATGQPDLREIIYAGGQYIAAGGNTIMQSADGVTWTTVYQPTQGFEVEQIAYGNGIYVAGGSVLVDDGTGQNILVETGTWATSKDGVHWAVSSPHDPPGSEIIFGDGQFTMVGTTCGEDTGVQIQPDEIFYCDVHGMDTSRDGLTWTKQALVTSKPPFSPTSLGYANGLFLSVNYTGLGLETTYVSGDAVHLDATSTLSINIAGFKFGRIRVLGNTAYALSSSGTPALATTQDGYTWHLVGYIWGLNAQGYQVRNQGHFDDMVSYGDSLLAPVVNGTDFSSKATYSMWLGKSGQETWCLLSGYPSGIHGVAMAVHEGQAVVVGAKGEIFSTPPASSSVSFSCASGGDTFPGTITAESVPVNDGKGVVDPLILLGLLGLAGLRRRF